MDNDPNPLATGPTKWRAEHCVSHHYGCDCREWEHACRIGQLESELAALKAEIAGAVQSVRDAELFEDGIEADAHGLGIHTIADAYMAGRQHALDELDALLQLPVGEGE